MALFDAAYFTFAPAGGRQLVSLNAAMAPTWTGVHLASAAYRNSTYISAIGVTTAPANVTAGDFNALRGYFGTNAAFTSGTQVLEVKKTWTSIQAPEALVRFAGIAGTDASVTGPVGLYVGMSNVPTADSVSPMYGLQFLAEHSSGAFNVGAINGINGRAQQSVAATTATSLKGGLFEAYGSNGTVTLAQGIKANVLANGGTIITGVGVDIAMERSSGTFTTSIGLRIQAATGTIGTDIAIQSLGGQNRFVGSVKIGADSAPSVALDVTGAITSTGVIMANLAGGVSTQAYLGKDTSLAHGITSFAPTDAYFMVDQGAAAGKGRARIWGFSNDAATNALLMMGIAGTAPNAGVPVFQLAGAKKNGMSIQDLAATDTILAIVGGGTGNIIWSVLASGIVQMVAPITLKGYTVATLPAGVQGHTAFVTDALAPANLTAVVGGGAVVTPVFYNGAAWIAL